MKNKIISKILIVFVLMVSVIGTVVNAQTNEKIEGIVDSYSTDGSYKFSEGNELYLPFARYASDRIIIDEKVDGFGSSFAGQNIEINSDTKGVQVLFAGDSIRVNNEMEYAIMFAKNDITISSEIEKSVIVFAGQKLTITEDAKIKGDIICFSPNIEINGNVDGSVLGFCENAIINGIIGKDLRIDTVNIDLKDEIVKGNVYVETNNSLLKLPESYKEAVIKLIQDNVENKKSFNYGIIISAIITAAVFTLLYYLINKSTQEKLTKSSVNKVKQNATFVILTGAIVLMTIPVVMIALIILSAIGLYMVAIPTLIIYTAFLLVVGLLSTFIIGALISEYMSDTKYLNEKGKKTKYLFAFVMYLVLYIFARLPFVGGYITCALVMLATGSTLCFIFKKEKNDERKIEDFKTEDKA